MLRRYRAVARLSQEALAEQAHLSWRAISDLERGVNRIPQRETVRLLAEALALAPRARAAFEAAAGRRNGASSHPAAESPPAIVGRA
jgi:transcriptional regulator with XRE-family HTH domain